MKRSLVFLLKVLLLLNIAVYSCSGEQPECEASQDCATGKSCINKRCVCETPNLVCDQVCMDVFGNDKHCGRCGNTCIGGTKCVTGVCKCPEDTVRCGTSCVDVRTDAKNCGDCGQVCENGERCVEGACRKECPAPTPTICADACVDTQANAEHCGACDKACAQGRICLNGECQCRQGQTKCGDTCVDLNANRDNCGVCGNKCGPGKLCASGRCLASCPKSTPRVCAGACVDVQTDALNCGGCTQACGAGKLCRESKCVCPAGRKNCGGSCVDVRTDSRHCGQCGSNCAKGSVCARGRCVQSCPNSTLSKCAGGCFDTKTDNRHCGGCGKACAEGFVCNSGKCECPKDLKECSGKCIDPKLDPNNCGDCGTKCSAGKFCAGGKGCVSKCPTETPSVCYGGCVEPKTDNSHCGRCGNKCEEGRECKAGVCTCPGKLTACLNACVNIETDNLNCGSCGNACVAGQICTKGKCTVVCTNGLKGCNNACVDLQTSNSNCGECDKVCPGLRRCAKGKCACPQGRLTCNGQCVDSQVDPANCGACGKSCAAGEICVAGACKSNCGGGLTNCSGKCFNISTDVKNCGGCGKVCATGQFCAGGTCACPGDQQVCNGKCEANIKRNPQHCGACGKACKVGERCDNGVCTICGTQAIACGQTCCPKSDICVAGKCYDPQTSLLHCGKANNACKKGSLCCTGSCLDIVADAKNCGACGKTCKTGENCCGGGCINLQNDPKNCGACGNACAAGAACCKGVCAVLGNDDKNCGSCGKVCAAGQGCCARVCRTLSKTAPTPYKGAPQVGSEQCDGLDNDCDGLVDEGIRRSCYGGPTGTAGKGNCRNGQQECKNGQWDVCVGEKLPQAEVCNRQDDDCNGKIDDAQGCGGINYSFSPRDYAIMSNGGTFALNWSSQNLYAECRSATGAVTTKQFTVRTSRYYIESYLEVRANTTAKLVLTTWVERVSSPSSSRNLHAQLFDENCKAVTSVIVWPFKNPGSAHHEFSVSSAIADNGNFVLMYRLERYQYALAFYDKAGKLLNKNGQPAIVNVGSNAPCRNRFYGFHVDVDKAGNGVVTCQESNSTPIYYRRFKSDGTFLDPAMVEIRESRNNSSSSRSHSMAVRKSDGAFFITWQARTKNRNEVLFFDKNGKKSSLLLPETERGQSYSGYDSYGSQKLFFLGNDVVLRDTVVGTSYPTMRLFRYKYDEQNFQWSLVSAAVGPFQPYGFRINHSSQKIYGISRNDTSLILTDAIDLSVGKGLCAGKPCVCLPNSFRECYAEGMSTPRTPCSKGREYCRPDGRGYGACLGEVLPVPEVCGNKKDDDCDGSLDEFCTDKKRFDVNAIEDMDVAEDGSVVFIYNRNNGVFAGCLKPDGTARRARWTVAKRSENNSANPYNLLVRIAPKSKRFVLAWFRNTGSKPLLEMQWYDKDCKPTSSVVSLPHNVLNSYFSMAIDESGRVAYSSRGYQNYSYSVLGLYDVNGKVINQELRMPNPAGGYCRYQTQVALHPTAGWGVISCQGSRENTIGFQRFSLSTGRFIEAKPNIVHESVRSGSTYRSNWYHSHGLSMNSKGEFMIQWHSYSEKRFKASFYNVDSKTNTVKLIKHVPNVGTNAPFSRSSMWGYSWFKLPVIGDQFMVFDGYTSSSTQNWYLYNTQGVRLKKLSGWSTSFLRMFLRAGGTSLYTRQGNTITKDVVNFTAISSGP